MGTLYMADTRPLEPLPTSLAEAEFHHITAALNLKYAPSHGYAFHYYPFTTATAAAPCQHPLFGDRHASWCKILPAYISLKAHKPKPARAFTMVLDTDMASAAPNVSVEKYVDETGVLPIDVR